MKKRNEGNELSCVIAVYKKKKRTGKVRKIEREWKT